MFNVITRDLSKDYRIYKRPVDRLIESLTRKTRHSVFPALKNISFALKPGQSLGIIGDNGAGKSTLLKLLTGTITPSSGFVEMQGRVTALLELGAGFHPEFTGRQNIALACSLLGMKKEEIQYWEKEIIDFSGIEDFIDRPVKTYSSGMYVRLGFAVATCVEPEIMIIDEALSVGDINFQIKCIKRMGTFLDSGKTMLFCSHSMYQVQEICQNVLWIDRGEPRKIGPAKEVVMEYEDFCRAKNMNRVENNESENTVKTEEGKDCYIKNMTIETPSGDVIEVLKPFTDIVIKMEVLIASENVIPQFGVGIFMSDDSMIAGISTFHDEIICGPYQCGDTLVVKLHLKDISIKSGIYRVTGAVGDSKALLWYETKDLWPIRGESNEVGVGLITFRRNWNIDLD